MPNPHSALHQDQYRIPNTRKLVEVTADDLPLHCPIEGEAIWNSHPRVFLLIREKPEDNDGARHARCPYCSTEFVLRRQSNS